MTFSQRYARFVTNLVVRRPWLWRLFRGRTRKMFDQIAPVWDAGRRPDSFVPVHAALEHVDSPRRALDLGTGTGSVAFELARRFPEAEIVGADIAPVMLAEARRKMTPDLEGRVRFDEADAEHLPYPDQWFDLVTLSNMIPFFDELDRVLAPGGRLVFAWSAGAETPIYVPSDVLERELANRGYADFSEIAAGRGNSFVARKGAEE